jgi:hypothetical protein
MAQIIRLIFSGFLVVMIVLACHPAALSQKRKTAKQPKADLFDDFGALGYCDLTARLDNFAITLQTLPKSTGYILSYAPPDRGQPISEQLKDYLVNSRGIDPDDLTAGYAGRNNVLSALRIQLWVVPDGALAPVPEKFDSKPETFKGMFYEHEGYDDIPYPGVGSEGEGFSLGVTLSAFTDVFKQQPKSVTYVVGYNGDTSTPGAWRRIAEDEIEFLKRGFETSRFKTIYGGNLKEAKVQVWIQPATDQPPVKEAGPESAPALSLQMGDYGDHDLGYTNYERTAFKRVAESLLGFPSLRACVIVRVGQPPEEPEEIEETEELTEFPVQVMDDVPAEPEEPTPPPADLLQLVEKWKRELAEKHQIREDRFVGLFSKTLPGYDSSLETWLVPQGESLPDPEALLREAESEKAPEQTNPQPVTKSVEAITMSEKPGKASDIGATTGKKP